MSARVQTLHRGLRAKSPHWACGCHTLVELVSGSVDNDLLGVGASPVPGDFSYTGVRVPAAPTIDQNHRYLIRLCGAEVPTGSGLIVRGVRLAATMRAEVPQTDPAGGTFVFEREIVSPFWHFVDGNVSFHLRWTQQVQSVRTVFDPLQLPGSSPSTFGVDSALLYTPNALGPFLGVYVPPGRGIPPGRDVDFLGTIRDAGRYPWTNTDWDLSVPVVGPGVVTLWASVFQTDPTHRIPPPQLAPPAPFTDPLVCGLRPEDQFLMQFPTCNYGRVAGALLLDLFPCCGDMEKKS
jgi:hypothetical protein